MAEHSDAETAVAQRRSPAAHLARTMQEAEVRGDRSAALREIPFALQVGVRAEPGTASAQAVEEALQVTLPAEHGRITGDAAGRHVIRLSPDEFLVVDVSREQRPGEVAELAGCLEGLPGQLVDLSANRGILELAGTSAREVLDKGCPLDLHPREFPVGAAESTQLGPVPVIVQRSAEDVWRILPRASFVDHTVRWLVDSMEEFAAEPLPSWRSA